MIFIKMLPLVIQYLASQCDECWNFQPKSSEIHTYGKLAQNVCRTHDNLTVGQQRTVADFLGTKLRVWDTVENHFIS